MKAIARGILSGKLALAAAVALAALRCPAQERAPGFPVLRWEPVFEGVERTSFRLESPRPIRAVALRIDLRAPGLSFLATPGNGPAEGETDGAKTTTFLGKNGLQAAINAAPYAPVTGREGAPEDVSGLHISEGEVVSPAGNGRRPALVLTRDNRATIADRTEKIPEGAWNAVSGFGVVLRDGRVVPGNDSIHPRTAAGIADDGRSMVWLVVDGRQGRFSSGATTAELGAWLRAMGCRDGINLDGGGTSTLVIQGADGPEILNRPIHAGIPGNERVAGSHLGLRAKPLAPPAKSPEP